MTIEHPLSSPPDDPDICEECGEALEYDQDGDYDSDGYLTVTSYTYCANEGCPSNAGEQLSYGELSEEQRRRMVEFVLSEGHYLRTKAQWDMEDNFHATEALHDVYRDVLKEVRA